MYFKNDHEMLIAFWWLLCCKTTFLKDMFQPCLYAVSKDCGKRRWRAYSAWTCPSWCKWFQRTSWIRKTKTGEPRNRPLFEHILTCVFRFDVFLCSYNMRVQRTRLPPPNSRAEIRRKPQLHQNTVERNALFAPSGAGGLIVTCLFAFFLNMIWMFYCGAFGLGSAMVQLDRFCSFTFSAFVLWSI